MDKEILNDRKNTITFDVRETETKQEEAELSKTTKNTSRKFNNPNLSILNCSLYSIKVVYHEY